MYISSVELPHTAGELAASEGEGKVSIIVIHMGESYSYPTEEAAAAAIREMCAGYDGLSAADVLRAVQRQAVLAARDGRQADLMVTDRP